MPNQRGSRKQLLGAECSRRIVRHEPSDSGAARPQQFASMSDRGALGLSLCRELGCSSRCRTSTFTSRIGFVSLCLPNPRLCLAELFNCRHRAVHLRPFPFAGFRNRTPGPPPFSSMNSTPAASKAFRTAKLFAAVNAICDSAYLGASNGVHAQS